MSKRPRSIHQHQRPESVSAELRQIIGRITPGTVVLRIFLVTALWMILAEGGIRYWGLVAAAIGSATGVSLILVPSSGLRWSATGWLRFAPFFIWQSIQGGVDVALRAGAMLPRVDPIYVQCRLRIDEEAARVLIANTMSLMPGTLSVSLDGHDLELHVLDREMPAVERVRDLEQYTARMFRLELPDDIPGAHPAGDDAV